MSGLSPKTGSFFWLDLEMTGLNPLEDRILEAACIITDRHFQEIHTYATAVFQPSEVLAGMNDWCKKTHRESGLVDRVPDGITESELDQQLLSLCHDHFSEEPIILAGNSIGQDRKFVDEYLPSLSTRLHYRMLDVSSFKIVFQTCYGRRFDKHNTHRALDDIRESIAELRHYLGFVKA